METSLEIQMNVKNNAQELQNYMLDMNNWEEEMKKKELSLSNENTSDPNIPPPRNKIMRVSPSVNVTHKNKKISAYDYSAWDKFDVEKACAEVDKENHDEKEPEHQSNNEEVSENEGVEVSNTSQKNLEANYIAFYEKELGNKFVKNEQWNDAIKCYTNAINLDPKNAIYYANRSLCFLKIKNFKAAEVDSTVAIQLEKNYVKAYQRRAFARMALGQLVEAKSDYEEVLRIEPKNSFARLEINKIEENLNKESKSKKRVSGKPTFNSKSIFKSYEQISQTKSVTDSLETNILIQNNMLEEKRNKKQDKSCETMDEEKKKTLNRGDGNKEISQKLCKMESGVFKPLPDWCSVIHPINIPPHKRSKKTLRRINIVQVDAEDESLKKPVSSSERPKEVEKKNEQIRSDNNSLRVTEDLLLSVPKTSIQFQNGWKVVKKNPEVAYSYLKQIPGHKLPQIFENSLESDFFSELVTFIASDEIKKEPEVVYDFLWGLSNVKRFSSMILFMSGHDKVCVKKSIAELEQIKSQSEISELIKLYEL